MADSEITLDSDCPELTDEQLKILSLVLSHSGVRGNARLSFYYQGREEERVNSLRNLMQTMNWTLPQALEALSIPMQERQKYAQVIYTGEH
ncbi:MAG: hypothetical protein IJ849_11150 [Selenomonadaceae bacterium]|nr:hypothetical protein [Selenomonadaceae bacterium]